MKAKDVNTVRRALFLLLLSGGTCLQAAEITTLYNTGVSDTGALLAENEVDPHYTVIWSSDAAAPGPEAYVLPDVWPVEEGVWLVNGPDSKWIAPQADQAVGNLPGLYTFSTTFDLTGMDPSTARITGQLSVDNDVTSVRLNGIDVGVTASGFNVWTPFEITQESFAFFDGINILEFDVNNADGGTGANPIGLRVELTGRATSPTDLPSIVVQPQSIDLIEGATLSLSVGADGAAPLSFQWLLDGEPIAGATDTTYTVSGATTNASGTYSVTVSNDLGELTSEDAVVRVVVPFPGIYDTGVDDNRVVLADYAEDPHYELVVNATDPSGTTPIVQDSFLFPIVDGPWIANSELSKWIGPLGDTSLAAGGAYSYQLELDLTGLDPTTAFLSGKWASDNTGSLYLNGADTGFRSPGFGTFSTFNITNGFISGINLLEFRVANEDPVQGYTGLRVENLVGTADPQEGEVLAPRIVLHPRSVTNVITEDITLSVVADGVTPLTYQWFKDGEEIEGAGSSTLSFEPALPGDEGSYTVVVTNEHGTEESNPGVITLIQPQIGIYNTGLDTSGNPLPLGEPDPHYVLLSSPDITYPGPTAYAASGAPFPAWLTNSVDSQWITVRPSATEAAPGSYRYRLIFRLLPEDVATAAITAGIATDDSGSIELNGNPVTFTSGGFGGLSELVIPQGSPFVAGLNALDFIISNGGAAANPTGLRVENLVLTGATIPDEPPALSVSETDGSLRIAWPSDAAGFVLQETTALPGGWTDSSAEVTVEGNQNVALIPLDGSARFFRLFSE